MESSGEELLRDPAGDVEDEALVHDGEHAAAEGKSEGELLEEAGVSGEQRPGSASVFGTALNMLNELEGSGLLGLPYAVRLVGWAALGCMGVAGVMAGITGYLLAACMYDATGVRVRKSYGEVGKAVFGTTGETVVTTVQTGNLVCVGVVYLVLLGSTMHSLHSILQTDIVSHADQRAWTGIATLCVLPTVHLGGYHRLSFLSGLGIVCLVAIITLGIGCSLSEIHADGAEPMPDLKIEHLPTVFSMFVFAFSAHGIFPDLQASMRSPDRFGSVVSVVFVLNITVKLAFTLTGFYAYGGSTHPVLAANLPKVAKYTTSVLIVLNTLLSFALPLIPVFKNLTRLAAAYQIHMTGWRAALMRSCTVLLCGVVAASIPNFAVAMGFMGSLTLSFLTFIFPCVFYMKLNWERMSTPVAAGLCGITAVGIVGGVTGIWSTVLLITSPPNGD